MRSIREQLIKEVIKKQDKLKHKIVYTVASNMSTKEIKQHYPNGGLKIWV